MWCPLLKRASSYAEGWNNKEIARSYRSRLEVQPLANKRNGKSRLYIQLALWRSFKETQKYTAVTELSVAPSSIIALGMTQMFAYTLMNTFMNSSKTCRWAVGNLCLFSCLSWQRFSASLSSINKYLINNKQCACTNKLSDRFKLTERAAYCQQRFLCT